MSIFQVKCRVEVKNHVQVNWQLNRYLIRFTLASFQINFREKNIHWEVEVKKDPSVHLIFLQNADFFVNPWHFEGLAFWENAEVWWSSISSSMGSCFIVFNKVPPSPLVVGGLCLMELNHTLMVDWGISKSPSASATEFPSAKKLMILSLSVFEANLIPNPSSSSSPTPSSSLLMVDVSSTLAAGDVIRSDEGVMATGDKDDWEAVLRTQPGLILGWKCCKYWSVYQFSHLFSSKVSLKSVHNSEWIRKRKRYWDFWNNHFYTWLCPKRRGTTKKNNMFQKKGYWYQY